MKKCRYIPDCDLPPLASTEQLAVLNEAVCKEGFKVEDLASRYANSVWRIGISGLINAVKKHITENRKIFQKHSNTSNQLLKDKLQANVCLYEESEDEDDEVYVELILRATHVVLILDAHNHHRGLPRLPR